MTFDNVRRMAERGLKMAQHQPIDSNYVDVFQHILDECGREAKSIKNAAIDEAVKALYKESYDDEYGIQCFNNNAADKIKLLKE